MLTTKPPVVLSSQGFDAGPPVAVARDEVVALPVDPDPFDLHAVPERRHDDRSLPAPRQRSARPQAHVAQPVHAGEEETGEVGVERTGDRFVRETVRPILMDVGEAIRTERRVSLLEQGAGPAAVALVG